MTDIATLGLSVTSQGVKEGSKELDRLTLAAKKAEGAATAMSSRTSDAAKRVEAATAGMGARATDAARKIEGSHQAAMRSAERLVGNMRAVEGATTRAYEKATVAANRLAVANDNVRVSTANVAAQLQDIGVTAAMGMSPLQIALQQGTQLSAAFGTAGAAGAVKALGVAFTSLVSPVALLTMGLVAGAAALVQYFMTTEDEAENADAAIKAHEAAIRALREAYGEAGQGLEEYARRSKIVADAMAISAGFQLKDELESFTRSLVSQGALIQHETEKIKARMQELTEQRAFSTSDPAATMAINKELAELQSQLEVTASSALAAADRFAPFRKEILAFGETVKAGKPDFIALQEAIARIVKADPSNEALARLNAEINGLIEKGVTFQSGMQANATAIQTVGTQARASAEDVSAFSRAVSELAQIAVPALTDTQRAQEALQKALDAADRAGADSFILRREALAEYAATMQRVRNEIAGADVPIPEARPSDIERIDAAVAALKQTSQSLLDPWEGMREVTGHVGRNVDDMTTEAENLKDALTDAAGASMTDLFDGEDDLAAFLFSMENDQ